MTIREQYSAVLKGNEPDRIPWLPRLELWYNGNKARGILPGEFQGLSLREIEKKLGLGTPARKAPLFSVSYRNIKMVRKNNGPQEITELFTPYGQLRRIFSASSLTHHLNFGRMWTEYPVKRIEDLPAMEYIISRMEFEAQYEQYYEYDKKVGQDGFPMVIAGLDPFHHILLELTGYETGYALLFSYRKEMERFIKVVEEKFAERDELILNSPAKLVCLGQHFDAQMTPPPIFQQYMVPYYQKLSERLHDRGIKLACHADADCTGLLELILEAGFDMAECFTCAPMVQCTLEEARRVWGERLIIFGGIPSTIITESVSESEFRYFVDDLFRIIAPGKNIILGVGDNVMPEAIWERFLYLTKVIKERGVYPVS